MPPLQHLTYVPPPPSACDPAWEEKLNAAAAAAWEELAKELEPNETVSPADAPAEPTTRGTRIEEIRHPERFLAEYERQREASELNRILKTAARLSETVDCVAVVGGKRSCLAAQAITNSCAHPYHNELSRAERGGQPRLYFLDAAYVPNNDQLAGWLDLVTHEPRPSGPEGSWAIIAIADEEAARQRENSTPGIEATLKVLIGALGRLCGYDKADLGRRVIPIGLPGGWLDAMSKTLACQNWFAASPGPGAIFSSAALLPAAIVGLDIRRLLDAAARASKYFRQTQPPENDLVNYVMMPFQYEAARPFFGRIAWEPAGRFTPIRSWHQYAILRDTARLPPNDRAHSSPWHTTVFADRPQRDRLIVPESWEPTADETSRRGNTSLRDWDVSFREKLRQRFAESGARHDALQLSQLNEAGVGQLCQWLLIAAELEKRIAARL